MIPLVTAFHRIGPKGPHFFRDLTGSFRELPTHGGRHVVHSGAVASYPALVEKVAEILDAFLCPSGAWGSRIFDGMHHLTHIFPFGSSAKRPITQ